MALTPYPHQIEMIDKAKSALKQGHKALLLVCPCGSGKTVIASAICDMAIKKGKRILIIVHRTELVKNLRDTLIDYGCEMDKVYVGMTQTISIMKNLDEFCANFDMIIHDEAHHGMAKSFRRILDKFTYRIGFTATPIINIKGDGMGELYDTLIIGKSTQWLIDNNFLAPALLFASQGIDYHNIKTTRGEYDQMQQSILLEHENVYRDCVLNYQRHADGLRTIVYNVSVVAADGTAAAFRAAGYRAAAVNGKTPDKIRAEFMRRFNEGELDILTNALLYDEGISVDGCHCTMFWKKTKSLRLWIQATMRCMRYEPGKIGRILDAMGNYEEHDLPWADREWSLDVASKKQKGDAPVKCCPECESVIYASQMKCPHCGYIYPINYIVPEIELQEINADKLRKMPYNKYKKFTTWDEIEEFRKARGYKPFFSIYKSLELGIKIPEKYSYQAELARQKMAMG